MILMNEPPGVERFLKEYGGPEFPFPEIAGTYKGKNIVVCGDAIGVWDDLESYGCRLNQGRGKVGKEGHDFMVVNKLGETFPGRIEHWYSNEPEILAKFVNGRRHEYKYEFDVPQHTHSCNRGAKWLWPYGGHGSSGLGAVLTALALGYDKVIICGMPLDDGPHNGEPHWRKCHFESKEVADQVNGKPDLSWTRAIDLAFDGKVTSMSGRTRKWLGAPLLS